MGLPNDMGMYAGSRTAWVPGSGAFDDGNWSQIGGTGNWRSTQLNSQGQPTLTWKVERVPEETNVGWEYYTVNLSGEKTFRESIWIYKNVAGSGEMVREHGATRMDRESRRNRIMTSTLQYLDGTGIDLPGYSENLRLGTLSDTVFPPEQWFLCVNFIFSPAVPGAYGVPIDYGDPDWHRPDSGIYYPDGTKLDLTGIAHYDSQMETTVDTITYLRTITTTFTLTGSGTPVVQMYQPRCDVVDGTEPTIQELLRNGANRIVSINLGNIII